METVWNVRFVDDVVTGFVFPPPFLEFFAKIKRRAYYVTFFPFVRNLYALITFHSRHVASFVLNGHLHYGLEGICA